MKKMLAVILIAWVMIMACGCAKKEVKEAEAVPAALVAYAAYQYESGYQPSEGWIYEMTISDGKQLEQLNTLADGLKLTVRDEAFGHERGFHLVFKDAQGSIMRELLIMEDGTVSMNGVVYDAEGGQALLDWLTALRIEEQNVE